MAKSNLYATFQSPDTYVFTNRIWIKSFLICPGAAQIAPFTFALAISGNTNYASASAGLVDPLAANQPKDFIEITLGVADGKAIHYPVNIRNVGNLIIETAASFSVVMEYEFESN